MSYLFKAIRTIKNIIFLKKYVTVFLYIILFVSLQIEEILLYLARNVWFVIYRAVDRQWACLICWQGSLCAGKATLPLAVQK